MSSRAALMDPAVIVAPVAATPIFPGQSSLDGFWIQVAVRDMHTSSYVGIGNKSSQASLMYYANDFLVWDCPPGYVLNFADFYCVSEFGDVELEVTGMRPVNEPSGLLPGVTFPSPLKEAI